MELFFTSPHCSPCRKYKPLIEAEIKAGRDIKVVDVSTPDGASHAEHYGVMGTPAYVLDSTPEEVSYGPEILAVLYR